MDNLLVYNAVRKPPEEALKPISGGRLKGKTDINPMWRLKALTEQFGICGVGWKYVITKQWLETGGKEEIAAFVNIDLFIKVDGAWSDAIPGTGGSSFVAKESGGMYTNDECFKMALTDAVSVSCKALGFAADIYWQADNTKYNNGRSDDKPATGPKAVSDKPANLEGFFAEALKIGYTKPQVLKMAGVISVDKWTRAKLGELYKDLETKKLVGTIGVNTGG